MQPINNYNYRITAEKERSSVDLIKFISIETWNRISFIHHYSNQHRFMRIFEVTLTQNLIYELIKFSIEKNMVLVGLYESKNEDTNGSDILVCVELSKGYIKIPLQAKLLKTYRDQKNGSYKSFWHSNTNGLQIKLLDKYAKSLGSNIGLYLLYNFTKNSSHIDKKEHEHYYGCSYATCNAIKKEFPNQNNVTFANLHPKLSKPFYHFFHNGGNALNLGKQNPNSPDSSYNDIKDFYKNNGIVIDDAFISNIKFYSREEIFGDEENWKNLVVSNDGNLMETVESRLTISEEFNPKYRMVLVATPSIEHNMMVKYITVPGDRKTQRRERGGKNNKETPVYV